MIEQKFCGKLSFGRRLDFRETGYIHLVILIVYTNYTSGLATTHVVVSVRHPITY